MSYSIITSLRFEKELKRLVGKFPSLRDEFAGLITDISEHPKTGILQETTAIKYGLPLLQKVKAKEAGQGLLHIYT